MDASFKPADGNLPLVTHDVPLAVRLAQAELDQAVTTAKAYPRSITAAMTNILTLTTLDEKSAAECVYAVPRDGKAIRGPSIRLAEIIASCWGNCHIGSRVVAVDRFEKVVIAEGVFHDLETGMKRVAQVQRRISDKNGRLYKDDMIATTGNAACSVALREAILKGVPKAIWRKAFETAEGVISGNVTTLVQRRADLIKAFQVWGITPEQIFACVDVGGIDDIGLEEMATLRATYASIKSGDSTVEAFFPPSSDKAKADEQAREAARARASNTARPAAQGESDQPKPKAEPEKVAAKAKPQDQKAPEAKAEPEAQATQTETVADDPIGDLMSGKDDEHRAAAQTDGDDDLLSTPFAQEVLRDAADFGETAARATHAQQLAHFAENDRALFDAIDAELKKIGG